MKRTLSALLLLGLAMTTACVAAPEETDEVDAVDAVPYGEQWNRYFEDEGCRVDVSCPAGSVTSTRWCRGQSCSASGTTVTCDGASYSCISSDP